MWMVIIAEMEHTSEDITEALRGRILCVRISKSDGPPKSYSEFESKCSAKSDEGGLCRTKRKRFSVEQIVAIVKQVEMGIPVAELIRRVGISEQAFYRWKKQFTGLEIDQVRQLKQLQDENCPTLRLLGALWSTRHSPGVSFRIFAQEIKTKPFISVCAPRR
jgi:putative transposase